jgi:predicted nucleic acid-binding protein
MIAADTSTWIAFFQGERGKDVELLDRALKDRQIVMAPPVLTELLSDPGISAELSKALVELPLVELQPGFWERAGALRSRVLAKHRKGRLGDALIAQSCLDAGIPLLTRDRDFRPFSGSAALKLLADFGQGS